MMRALFTTRRGRLILAGLVLATVFIIYGIYLVSGLPSLEQLENPRPELATKVYSADGEILDHFYIKNRTSITLNQLPKGLVDALIATEDKNFYEHWGVDLPRFMRAMVKNLLLFRLREGASTITQQLARNLYELKGANESVFGKMTRKIREFITAVQIEHNYTKEEILEMYLSVAFFGRSAYGIASASQVYFGKQNPADLTLSESALLIGLLKGPGAFDPFRHAQKALNRRNTVIDQMVKYDYITKDEGEEAKNEQLHFQSAEESATGIAPHFVEWVRQQLLEKAERYGFDIYRDGLSVYTTLDSRMQRYANRAVEEHLSEMQPMVTKQWNWKEHGKELEQVLTTAIRNSDAYRDAGSSHERDSIVRALRKNPKFIDSVKTAALHIEVGFVVVDHHNGNIVAMVGGSNFRNFKYGLNHVTQIRRQPGSAFKPFVYTVAIDNGYPPCFELLNQPVTLVLANGKRWAPENFDHTFGGKSTLRNGITYSINLVAIRAIMEIAPVKQVIDYAHRMGIKSELPPYESLAIGTGEVQPLEITAAYGVFPNEGVYVEPTSILRIEDKDGNVIEENQPVRKEVLSPETAYIMTNMMEDNVNIGTGVGIRARYHFYGPAAGKTGTTQDYGDAWFVGFTPHLTAGTWVGFDDKSIHFTTADGQGGRAAAPIWALFMKYVYADRSIGLSPESFVQPPGVETDTICTETKKLATPYCPETTVEIFNKKYVPGKCDKHTSWRSREAEDRKNTIHF